jgi:site-specific recombinase XerD
MDRVGESLVEQRYLRVVVIGHLQEWLRFTRDLDQRRIAMPSTIYAPAVQRYLKRRFPGGSASRFRCIRAAIRIFLEADEYGNFARRMRAPGRPTTKLFKECVPTHLVFLRRLRNVSEKTLATRERQLALFMEFLKARGVSELRKIQAALIHDFLTQLEVRKASTIRTYATSVRGFLRWTFLEGLLDRDLSPAAKAVRHYRLAHLPDVMKQEELTALLAAVDRSSPLGRRDYAVLLLAARYGLRPSDIRHLSLDDIDWRSGTIVFRQSKTQRELALPLLPDVSEALIAYLRQGRPATERRTIFIRHRAPFEPFAPNNNLPTIMRAALGRVGLGHRPGRRGLYLLRHTLATQLMSEGQSVKTIGDILGHATTESTLIYTKVDEAALRSVALSPSEVLQ